MNLFSRDAPLSIDSIRAASSHISLRQLPVHVDYWRARFVVSSAPKSIAAASYRTVCDRILFSKGSNGVMLITSSGPGEGKTITSVNLALTFAEKKQSVLLLELSLTRPRFQDAFGIPGCQKGIQSLLSGHAEPEQIIGNLGNTGVQLAGVTDSASADVALLFPNEYLDNLLRYSRSKYDWTILDVPDVGSCPQTAALAARADSVILVIRSRHTQLRVLRQAICSLGPHLTSILMNGT
jgi:polysaccharide biosynthesis transport protein